MKVKYTEGPESLVIAECNKQVKRGEPVDVPEAVAKKLLEQGWQEAKAPAPKPVEKPEPTSQKKKED